MNQISEKDFLYKKKYSYAIPFTEKENFYEICKTINKNIIVNYIESSQVRITFQENKKLGGIVMIDFTIINYEFENYDEKYFIKFNNKRNNVVRFYTIKSISGVISMLKECNNEVLIMSENIFDVLKDRIDPSTFLFKPLEWNGNDISVLFKNYPSDSYFINFGGSLKQNFIRLKIDFKFIFNRIFIYKREDDWYIVEIGDLFSRVFYKVDGIDEMRSFLKKLFV